MIRINFSYAKEVDTINQSQKTFIEITIDDKQTFEFIF